MIDMHVASRTKKQLPAWFVGFLIAIVVFAIVVVIAKIVGYGDDPAIINAGAALSPRHF